MTFINDTYHNNAVNSGWFVGIVVKRNRVYATYSYPTHHVRKYRPTSEGWIRDYSYHK
jgi:hypothetical protein